MFSSHFHSFIFICCNAYSQYKSFLNIKTRDLWAWHTNQDFEEVGQQNSKDFSFLIFQLRKNLFQSFLLLEIWQWNFLQRVPRNKLSVQGKKGLPCTDIYTLTTTPIILPSFRACNIPVLFTTVRCRWSRVQTLLFISSIIRFLDPSYLDHSFAIVCIKMLNQLVHHQECPKKLLRIAVSFHLSAWLIQRANIFLNPDRAMCRSVIKNEPFSVVTWLEMLAASWRARFEFASSGKMF